MEMINEKKLIKPEMPRIKFNEGIDLYHFFTKNDEKVQNYIIESIKYAVQNKLTEVETFEIQASYDPTTILVLCFDKSEWTNTLQYLIDKYTKEDNFEKCSELQKIKKKIK